MPCGTSTVSQQLFTQLSLSSLNNNLRIIFMNQDYILLCTFVGNATMERSRISGSQRRLVILRDCINTVFGTFSFKDTVS